jgi:ABC-type multidrug transport system ATPase subunit
MPVLELRSLRKSYFSGPPRSPRRTDALLGVDLDVDSGEILGIVGNASSGKTTLLLCAAGLLQCDGGSIRWYGKRFAGGGCLPGLVYVPAVPTYYPFLTVRDVLHYYCDAGRSSSFSKERLIDSVAQRLFLTDFLATSAGNLDNETLKRVAIAQALVDDPSVVLLDGSLDALGSGAASVHRTLRHFAASGNTVIATSRHAAFLAGIATRIVVIDGGWLTGSFAAVGYSRPDPTISSFPPLRQIAERIH